MALREQGVPVKIVYLGHRDGTALMVGKDSEIDRSRICAGKSIAMPEPLLEPEADHQQGARRTRDDHRRRRDRGDAPARYAGRALCRRSTGSLGRAVHGPDRDGRLRTVLYQAKDIWPDFISCVLAVPEDSSTSIPSGCRGSSPASPRAESGSTVRPWTTGCRRAEFATKQLLQPGPAPVELRAQQAAGPGHVHEPPWPGRSSRRSAAWRWKPASSRAPSRFEEYADTVFRTRRPESEPYAWEAQ